jgi:nucleoside-diphosphate-sugar epimerase
MRSCYDEGKRCAETLFFDYYRQHKLRISDDPVQRQPDITLAREMLGWESTTVLRDGLMRTIEYFDRLLRLAPAAEGRYTA